MAFIITRINVGEYSAWKRSFDKDLPRAREAARGYRIFRTLDDPGEVYIQIEYGSREDALTARSRLLASGVLERFRDRYGPSVVDEVETVAR
jgi:hypothetical protein